MSLTILLTIYKLEGIYKVPTARFYGEVEREQKK